MTRGTPHPLLAWSPGRLLRKTTFSVCCFLLSTSYRSTQSAHAFSLFGRNDEPVSADDNAAGLHYNMEAGLIRPDVRKLPPNATYHGVPGVFIPIPPTTTPLPTTKTVKTTTTTTTTTTTKPTTTTTPKTTTSKTTKAAPSTTKSTTTTTTTKKTTTTAKTTTPKLTKASKTTSSLSTTSGPVQVKARKWFAWGGSDQQSTTSPTTASTLYTGPTTTTIALDKTSKSLSSTASSVKSTTTVTKKLTGVKTKPSHVSDTASTKKTKAGAAGVVVGTSATSTSGLSSSTQLSTTKPVDPKTFLKSVSLVFSNLPPQAPGSDSPSLDHVKNGSLPIKMYKDEPCIVGAYSRTNPDVYVDVARPIKQQSGGTSRNSWVTVVPRGETGSHQNMSLWMSTLDHSVVSDVNITAELVESSSPYLRSAVVSPGRLDPQFLPFTFAYHARVPENAKHVTLKFETLNDRAAQCTIDGEKWYVAHGTVSLQVPKNESHTKTFQLNCLGADKKKSATYVFNIVPQFGGETTLKSLGVLGAPLAPPFEPLQSGPYTADLVRGATQDKGPEIQYTQVRAVPTNPKANVTIEGYPANATNNYTSPWFRVPKGETRQVRVSVRTLQNPVAEEYIVKLVRGASNLPWYEKSKTLAKPWLGWLSTIVSAVSGRTFLQNNHVLRMISTEGHQLPVSEPFDSWGNGFHVFNSEPRLCDKVQVIPSNTTYSPYEVASNCPDKYDGKPVAGYKFFLSGTAAEGDNNIPSPELFGGFYDTHLGDFSDLIEASYAYDAELQAWRETNEPDEIHIRQLIALSADERRQVISQLESARKAHDNLVLYTTTMTVVTVALSVVAVVYALIWFAYLQESGGASSSPYSGNSSIDASENLIQKTVSAEAEKQGGLRLRSDYPTILHPIRFWTFVFDVAFVGYLQAAVGILFCCSSKDYNRVSIAGINLSIGALKFIAAIVLLECIAYVAIGAAMLSKLQSHMTFGPQFCEYHDVNLTHGKALHLPKFARFLPIIGRFFTIELTSVAPLKSAADPNSQAVTFDTEEDTYHDAAPSGYSRLYGQDEGDFHSSQNIKRSRAATTTSSSASDIEKAGESQLTSSHRHIKGVPYRKETDAIQVAINDFVYNHQVTNYDNRNAAVLSKYPTAKLGETSFILKNAYGYPLTLHTDLQLQHLTAFMQLIDNFTFWLPRDNCQFSAKDAWYNLLCHAGRGLFFDWAVNRALLFICIALATYFNRPQGDAGDSNLPLFILIAYSFAACFIRIPSYVSTGLAKRDRDMIRWESDLKEARQAHQQLQTAEQVWPFNEPGFVERFHSVKARKEARGCFGLAGLFKKSDQATEQQKLLQGPADRGFTRSTFWYATREVLFGIPTADFLLGVLGICLYLSRRSLAKPLLGSGALIPICVCIVAVCLLNLVALCMLGRQLKTAAYEALQSLTHHQVSMMDLFVNNGSLGERMKFCATQMQKLVTFDPTCNFHYPRAGISVRRFPIEEVKIVSNELGLQLPCRVGSSTKYLETTVPNKNRLRLHKTLVIHGGIGDSRSENLRTLPVQVPFYQLFRDVDGAPHLNTEGSIDRLVATIQVVNHTFRANAAGLSALKDSTHDSYLSLYASEQFFPSPGKLKLRRSGHTYSVRYDAENMQLIVRGPAIVNGRKYYLRTAQSQPSRQAMYQNAQRPHSVVSDDSSLPKTVGTTGRAMAQCVSPGALRVEVPVTQTPDLYKDIHIESPMGAHYVVDPNQIKVYYDPDCNELFLRYQDLSLHPKPYIVTWTIRDTSNETLDCVGTASSNGTVYFPLQSHESPPLDKWLTMRDENGAVIDIDPKQTDAYQFFFPEKTSSSPISNFFSTLMGRSKAVWSFLRGHDVGAGLTEEPIPCTVVQCVNPIDRIYRVDPNFLEAYKVRNARVHELRARQAATENSEALPQLCQSLMTPQEYVTFWKKHGVDIVDEVGNIYDPLAVDQDISAFHDKYKEIAIGEADIRQVLIDRLEKRIQDTLTQMEKVRIWIRAYNDPDLHTTQLERDLADWSLRPASEITAKLNNLKAQKAAYEQHAENFVYPCNIPDVFISKRPNLSAQFRVWSDILQSWFLFEEGANVATSESKARISGLVRSVMQHLKSTLYCNEMRSLNAYRSILHYVVGSQVLRTMDTRWCPDSFRAHTALVRIWPEKHTTKENEEATADFSKYPEWLPCLLRLTPNAVQMLLPNGDDLTRAAEGDYPWQRSTGLYVPLHAFQKFELLESDPASAEQISGDDNPLLKSMTTRLVCRKNQMGDVDDGYARRMEDDQLGNEICFTDSNYQRRMRYKMMLGHCVPPSQVDKYGSHEVDPTIEAPEKNVHPLTFKMNPAFAEQWLRAIKMAKLDSPHDIDFEGKREPSQKSESHPPTSTSSSPPSSSTSSASIPQPTEPPMISASSSSSSVSEEQPVESFYEGGFVNYQYSGSGKLRNDKGKLVYDGDWVKGVRHGKGVALIEDTHGGKWQYMGEFRNDEMCGAAMIKAAELDESKFKKLSPDSSSRMTLVRFQGNVVPPRNIRKTASQDGDAIGLEALSPIVVGQLFDPDAESNLVLEEKLGSGGIPVEQAKKLRKCIGRLRQRRKDGDTVILDRRRAMSASGREDLLTASPQAIDEQKIATHIVEQYLPYKGRWLKDVDPLTGDAAVFSRLTTGTLQYVDGTVYQGQTRAALPHGSGRMSNPHSNLRYEGNFDQGVPHGYGYVELGEDDYLAAYDGTFDHGKRHGSGMQIMRNGKTWLKGTWENDEIKDGEIVLSMTSELAKETSVPITRYEGNIKNGQADGEALVHFTSDYIYQGSWLNGKKHGNGKLLRKDGSVVYIGNFKDGVPNGRAVRYVLSDKTIYCGNVTNGLRQGMGELYAAADEKGRVGPLIYDGLWSNDVPHGRGTWYGKDGDYDGEWKHGNRHGKGRFVFKEHPLANGKHRVYEGDWVKDKPSGVGKYLADNGVENVYRFEDGNLVSSSKSSYKPFCGSAPDIKTQPTVQPSGFRAEKELSAFTTKSSISNMDALLKNVFNGQKSWALANAQYTYTSPDTAVTLQRVRHPHWADSLYSEVGGIVIETPKGTASQSSSTDIPILKVFIVEGKKMKDMDTIGKMDPYVKVMYGSSQKKTKPIKSGGSNCQFNKTLMFPRENGVNKLKLEVWDADKASKDDLVGSAEVSLKRALETGEDLMVSVPLTVSGKGGRVERRGELIVNLFFTKVARDYTLQPDGSQKSVASEEALKAPHAKVTVHTCTEIVSSKREAVQPMIKVTCGHKQVTTATGSGVNVAYDETLCLPWNGAQTINFELIDVSNGVSKGVLLGNGEVNIAGTTGFSSTIRLKDPRSGAQTGVLDVSITLNK